MTSVSQVLELEQYFSEALDCRIHLCICTEEAELAELSSGEMTKLTEMRHEEKRKTWLRGRFALKTLLSGLRQVESEAVESDAELAKQFSESLDTSLLRFPHKNFSLSHSGELAIAVAAFGKDAGTGVDIERERPMKEGSQKYFLQASEQDCLSCLEPSKMNDALLRIWTTKEALFKADLNNQGKTLSKYHVLDPLKEQGHAETIFHDETKRFLYASRKLPGYWLTIATCL